MARSKKLTDEQNKARARAQSHTYRHRSNNLPARVFNNAQRKAAKWVREEFPQQWGAFVRLAKKEEEQSATEYIPHSVKFSNGKPCSHPKGKVVAVGIMRKCTKCNEFVGAYPVEVPENKKMLQKILEAEDGA